MALGENGKISATGSPWYLLHVNKVCYWCKRCQHHVQDHVLTSTGKLAFASFQDPGHDQPWHFHHSNDEHFCILVVLACKQLTNGSATNIRTQRFK